MFDVMKTTAGSWHQRHSDASVLKRLTLGLPRRIRVLHELHEIRSFAARPAIPQAEPLRANVLVNEFADRWPEGLIMVRPDPDEVPVRILRW